MMKRVLTAGLLLGLLSACGVEGNPTKPADAAAPATGAAVTISGDARVGVSGSF